jgi:hypothetical protein
MQHGLSSSQRVRVGIFIVVYVSMDLGQIRVFPLLAD